VSRISFELPKGELLGVIGPNGSGKTTTVNLITGFVKATSGRCFTRAGTSPACPLQNRAPRNCRTFQMVKPFYQLPAFKNMIIPLYSPRVKLAGESTATGTRWPWTCSRRWGFERDAQVAYKVASVLPQGYLKRLELAKAIALQPDLMILDELFSGLSLAEVASIVPIIEKLRWRERPSS
jgi:branched-chain amino acid transport system ATP-binding protein